MSKMDDERYPMHEIMYTGNKELLKKAIADGGNVNERNLFSKTPVFIAIERNDYLMLKILIDAGARVDVTSYFGESPLWLAKEIAKDDKEYFDTNIITLIENTLNNY